MKNEQATIALFEGQLLHLVGLTVLAGFTFHAWQTLHKPHAIAFWIAVAFPIMHQVYVWLAWRLELRSGATSRTLGFSGFLVVFFVLFGGRFVALAALAWLDRGSLQLSLLTHIVLTLGLLVPGLYAMYSVHRYFGMARAAGADHFEEKYRTMPFVHEGIFQYTDNGMYVYAFLLFWAIAIGLNSAAATTVAAFSHAYIWVHFQATEKPDIDFIYSYRRPQ